MIAYLGNVYNEKLFLEMNFKGRKVFIYGNELSGSWSLLVSPESGKLCFVFSGVDLQGPLLARKSSI